MKGGFDVGNFIDLHMHSTFSDDAEFTPTELVRQCKDAGIQIMSITDHNSSKANTEAKIEAKRLGIKYISGIEIDCRCNGTNLHLLGYGIDEGSPDFAAHEDSHFSQERIASRERLILTRKLGFDITSDELNAISNIDDGTGNWTGEAFAEALLGKKEYLDHELLKPYRANGERSDNPYANFYWDYYAQGKPCYVKTDFPSLGQAIAIIQKNGGKAVLAHPAQNLKGQLERFDEIAKSGIDGVEVFCSYHDKKTSEYFYDKALQYSLVVTCGSDYHGKTKPSVKLGNTGCWLGQSEIFGGAF